MQINLTGFLNGKNARLFMGELWELLLSAQASENGIPESFTQQKKEEIKKRMVNKFDTDVDVLMRDKLIKALSENGGKRSSPDGGRIMFFRCMFVYRSFSKKMST